MIKPDMKYFHQVCF